MKITQIPGFTREKRDAIGSAYVREIQNVIDSRTELESTWEQALVNYEGKSTQINFPWKDSSNAVIPITPTHTDAIYSRLYNTATGQDPIYMSEIIGDMDLGGVSLEDFTRGWEQLSSYVETSQVRIDDVMALALLIMTKYGDSIVYIPWKSQLIQDRDLDADTGEWTKVDEREMFGRPVPTVLHPENFYIPLHAHGPNAIQEAPWVAYEYELDWNQIQSWVDDKFFDEDTGRDLQQLLRPAELPPVTEEAHYLRDTGDTEDPTDGRRSLQRVRRELVGLDEELRTGRLKMYHVWAREDTDEDGLAEEINFHVHASTGFVPHISWNPYLHRKRPFERFQYNEREGVFYSIGVPEMLFNIQNILNQTMRDIMNNNKVQNTKMFLAQKNSGVQPNTRAYPGRILLVNDVTQFVPVDLGSGKPVTSVNDLLEMQQWGERRTGVSDINLGQENASRTPASTTLARLEEQNKRLDLVIRRMRITQDNIWDQVMSLYAQFGFSDEVLDSVLGEEAEVIKAQISNLSAEDIQKHIRFQARVSTQNLNRAVRREEALTLFGQLQAFYEQILGLSQVIAQTPQPAFRELFIAMATGYKKAVQRYLDTFEGGMANEMAPDMEDFISEIFGGAPDGLPSPGSGEQRGSQVEQATANAASGGGAGAAQNPLGRPAAGLPRTT